MSSTKFSILDRGNIVTHQNLRLLTCTIKSPIFDILNTCHKFGLFIKIERFANGIECFMGKKSWSKLIWEWAVRYDDSYWKSYVIDRKFDLLVDALKQSGYLHWWYLSDVRYNFQKMCEVMTKIVCRTSLLKSDDYRYNDLTPSHRLCERCNMTVPENISHLIMQCPEYEGIRTQMYNELNPFTLIAAKRGLMILEIFSLQKHFFKNIWRRNVDQKISNNSPWNISQTFALFPSYFQKYESSRRYF